MFGSCSGILNISALLKKQLWVRNGRQSRTHHMLRQPDLLPFRDKTHWGTFDARRTPLSSHNPCLHTVTVQKRQKANFIISSYRTFASSTVVRIVWIIGKRAHICFVGSQWPWSLIHKSRTSLSAQSTGNSLKAILRYCVHKNGTDGRTSSLKT